MANSSLMALVDWSSAESHLFLNPRLADSERQEVQALYAQTPPLASHLWLTTSGSTRLPEQSLKLVALSKKAFLVAAESANRHLQASAQDRWLVALPHFHVGGLAIAARATLSGAAVFELGVWSARDFATLAQQEKITLSALVPTQIYDLVNQHLRAPPSLRAIVVGGGVLPEPLYLQARELGWPLLPSFGMSECCSQVATAERASLDKMGTPRLRLLSHIKAQVNQTGALCVRSDALLSCYAQSLKGQMRCWDPKQDGWFVSEDRVALDSPYLMPLGRSQDFVKISGESVSLHEINGVLAQVAPELSSSLLAIDLPEPRAGAEIVLVTDRQLSPERQQELLSSMAQRVLPVARPKHIFRLDHLPVTALGKWQLPAIRAQILRARQAP